MIETTFDTEPIVGYRAFHVNDYGEWTPIGIGAFSGDKFKPGNKYRAKHLESTVLFDSPHKPFAECQCGFYGWKTMDAALKTTKAAKGLFYIAPILLSGIVVEHEFGYRATEMTVLQYEHVLQFDHYAVRHTKQPCPTEDLYGECVCAADVALRTRIQYTRDEWETAIADEPWKTKELYDMLTYDASMALFYRKKEIDLEWIQSESHSGE